MTNYYNEDHGYNYYGHRPQASSTSLQCNCSGPRRPQNWSGAYGCGCGKQGVNISSLARVRPGSPRPDSPTRVRPGYLVDPAADFVVVDTQPGLAGMAQRQAGNFAAEYVAPAILGLLPVAVPKAAQQVIGDAFRGIAEQGIAGLGGVLQGGAQRFLGWG